MAKKIKKNFVPKKVRKKREERLVLSEEVAKGLASSTAYDQLYDAALKALPFLKTQRARKAGEALAKAMYRPPLFKSRKKNA